MLSAADPAQLLTAVGAFGDFRPGGLKRRWGGVRYSTYDRVLLVKVHHGWRGGVREPKVPAGVPLYRFGYRHERGGPRFHVTGRSVECWGLTEHAAWLVPLWEDALDARQTS
jgi:hypothetical protein